MLCRSSQTKVPRVIRTADTDEAAHILRDVAKPGDMVLAVDGKPIERSSELAAAVFQHVSGEEITLDIQRGKEHLVKTVAVLARQRSPEDLQELASRSAVVSSESG